MLESRVPNSAEAVCLAIHSSAPGIFHKEKCFRHWMPKALVQLALARYGTDRRLCARAAFSSAPSQAAGGPNQSGSFLWCERSGGIDLPLEAGEDRGAG